MSRKHRYDNSYGRGTHHIAPESVPIPPLQVFPPPMQPRRKHWRKYAPPCQVCKAWLAAIGRVNRSEVYDTKTLTRIDTGETVVTRYCRCLDCNSTHKLTLLGSDTHPLDGPG